MVSDAEPTLPLLLIVEDSEDDYDAMIAAFEKAQVFNPFVRCRGGREALEYLKNEGAFAGSNSTVPGLILLDLNMPGIDGRKVLEKLKGDAKLKGIPVIILTTSNNDNDVTACYEAGAAAYMRKPADFNDLVRAVRRLKEFWFEMVTFPRGRTGKLENAADLLFNRGWRYQVGFDVKPDYVQAYSWYSRAAAAGHGEAAKRGRELAAKMTPEQLAEGERLVKDWEATKK